MANDIHIILTPEDRDALRRLLKMAGVPDIINPRREPMQPVRIPFSRMNTDTYIAKGDVPARDGTEPGKATCDIYWIKNADIGTPLLEDRKFDQIVFNVGDSAASDYFPVGRDKFGSWMVLGGGGGGSGTQTIAFSINAADCVTGEAIGTVLAIDCTNSSVKIGDTVDLLDFLLCFLTGNETLLLGRKGYASWMEDNNTNMSNYGCRWHITSLCKIDFGC